MNCKIKLKREEVKLEDSLENRSRLERPYYMRPHVLGMPRLTEPVAVQLKSNHSRMNISYKMSFKPPLDFRFGGDASSKAIISAERIYDRDTGLLCMIGCQQIQSVINQILIKSSSLDCQIYNL